MVAAAALILLGVAMGYLLVGTKLMADEHHLAGTLWLAGLPICGGLLLKAFA